VDEVDDSGGKTGTFDEGCEFVHRHGYLFAGFQYNL
jgi:hypothetical protein